MFKFWETVKKNGDSVLSYIIYGTVLKYHR